MSFQNLQHGSQCSSRSSTLSKEGCLDDFSFDRQIKSNIQEMQEAVRLANEHLHKLQGNRMPKRLGDSIGESIESSQDIAQKTEALFREWTVHLAGEPTARQKKKLLYEKLQKAFREEVQHLKETSRRAMIAKQETLKAESRQMLDSGMECHSVCEDQTSAMNDEEVGLLLNSESMEGACFGECVNQNFLAREREESIKRIQGQVSDVNQMFRDLASIVKEQEEPLMSIERQAESSSSNTKQAVKELRKASDRQRSHIDKLCCMVASIMLVLCFLVVRSFEHMPHLRKPRFG